MDAEDAYTSRLVREALAAKHAQKMRRLQRLMKLRERVNEGIRDARGDIIHLSVAAEHFGEKLPFPPPDPTPPPSLLGGAGLGRLFGIPSTVGTSSLLTGVAPPGPSVAALPTPPPSTGESGKQPKIKDVVLQSLRKAGPGGIKAGDIRQLLSAVHKIETHEKTVGMTLYRLLRAGLARREGFIWFYVPPLAEKKNPGGETPGISN